MKNIAIVCHDYKSSGANLSLVDWIKDLNKNEFSVTVVLPRYEKEYADLLKKSGVANIIVSHHLVIVKKLYSVDRKTKIKDIIKKVYAFLFHRICFYRTMCKLKKLNICLIHSNSFSTTFGVKLAQKMKIPHVWHIREFMEEDHQITHYFKKKDVSFCQYSAAIFISDVIAKKYMMNYSFRSTNILYNKIKYNDKYKKERKFLEDGILNMIIVGTISENKGHLDAIKCMKLLNEKNVSAQLFICGTGPNELNLKKYVEEENIDNVHFLGYRSDSIELRKKMDVSLMCSSNEALGRVTVEGMYYENLVIGANCGCTPYLIKDKKTGLLYNKKEENDLFRQTNYVLEHKEECQKIINNAKRYALQHFNRNIAPDIEIIYNSLLRGDKND